jgi:tetratricopeptide (TPR) repeat protein
MKFLRKIVVLALIVLFLSTNLCYGQGVVMQNVAKGVDFAAQGKFNEAKEEFEKALMVDLSNDSAKRALKVIEDVTKKKIGNKTVIHHFKGRTYYAKGQYDKAISDYNKAIEIDPNFAEAHLYRGNTYAVKGQYDQAISDYSNAIKINPKNVLAYNNRAAVYYDKREYDKAWEDIHKAQSLGYQVHSGFLKALREASGRQK